MAVRNNFRKLMYALLLVFFTGNIFSSPSYGQELDLLYLAAIRGDVEVTSRATQGGGYKHIYLNVRNNTGSTLNLTLLGSYFAPKHNSPSSSSQREAVVHWEDEEFGFNLFEHKSRLAQNFNFGINENLIKPVQWSLEEGRRAKLTITLAPYKTWKGQVTAFCIDPHRPAPRAMENYRLVPSALPEAIKQELIGWIKKPDTPQSAIQTRVWNTIKRNNIIFYDPQIRDSKTLRRWMQGSKTQRDGAELILIASKPGYWGRSLTAHWEQGLSSERLRAQRVIQVWNNRGWLSEAQVRTIQRWMKRSPQFKEMAALAIKASLPSLWSEKILDVWMDKTSSEQDLAEGVLIAWSEEEGRTASGEEIRLLNRWIKSVPSDKDRAEHVLERSRPTYWPKNIISPWLNKLSDKTRAQRILQLWTSEKSRKSASELAEEEETF